MTLDERRWRLLELLRQAQEELGYISEERMIAIAEEACVTPSEVFSVASFYDHFRLNPPGRHSVRVCTGTACHVKGASLVLSEWERELGIKAGETSDDGEFDLDEVACIGCCGLACAVTIDNVVQGEFKSADVKHAVMRIKFTDEQAAEGGTSDE